MFSRVLRVIFHRVQDALAKRGIVLQKVGAVPPGTQDAELYRPFYAPWYKPEWRKRLRQDDLHSLVTLDRKFLLHTLLAQQFLRAPGDVAECGVYKGGTAYLFAELLQGSGRTLHLFDTFDGVPETDIAFDHHKAGDFADTSLAAVRDYLAAFSGIAFHPGFVPATLEAVAGDRFAFVHIDLDIYDAVKTATAFFYERLDPGGVIVYDDYGWPSTAGARLAVDEFFGDKPEKPLVLTNGQCLIWKL